jgi:histidyl-tRNA synthetase
MKSIIQSIKGTRDFYPEDMALRNWIYNTARQVSESFGYQEYDAPFLESIELYAAKSGEELVKEQSFVFPDRSGDLITLRPELTLSLARMVAQRQRQLVYPLRWWSWGPFWRYERPQKGRYREFFQWNIDLIGVASPQADAELAAIAAEFLRLCGLTPQQVSIFVNNRALMESELRELGITDQKRSDVFRLIDRRDKMSPGEWDAYAADLGLTPAQVSGLKSLLANDELWQKSDDLQEFFSAVRALGTADYIKYSPQIIRGLDYYTGTVFETWDRDGEFRAILGGGRYDNLVADVGGDPLPGMGFAMGDAVISLVLKKFGCIPADIAAIPSSILVTVFDAGTQLASMEFAARLRQAGLKAACYPEPARIARQFKYGDRMGMRVAAVLGPDEIANDTVAIKNLQSGEQVSIQQVEAADFIRRMLETTPAS